MLNLGHMIEWCKIHEQVLTDDDEAFVIESHFSSFDEDLRFCVAFSTPLLLKMLSTRTTICIDATYKLNWLGYPLVVLGTVDRAKHFHPLVYACLSHERTLDYKSIFAIVKDAIKTHSKDFEPEILIADGADAIRNAYYQIFVRAILDVMCFAHVIRNC